MANNSADNEETIRKLNRLSDALGVDGQNLSIAERSKRSAAKADAEYKAAQEKLRHQISSGIDELTNFSKSVANSGNSFDALNSAIDVTAKVAGGLASGIPIIGDIAKAIIEGAAEVSKFMVDTFSNSYAQFEKLSDVGIVGKFEDLQQAGAAMRLNFSDTATVLKKYSSSLAGMEGSAERGRQLLERVSYATQTSRDEFKRIGVSAADFTDMVASSMEFENRARPGMQADITKSAKDAVDYAKNLDTLSKLTGISRKELQNKRIELLRDAKYRAGIANLDKPIRDNINNLIQQVGAVDQEYADGLKDLIASGGNPGNSPKAKAVYFAMQQGGIDVQTYIDGMRSGSISATSGMTRLGNAAAANIKKTDDLASKVGANTIATRLTVAQHNLATKVGQNLVGQEKGLIEAQQNNLTDGKTTSAQLADTSTSMYKTGQMFEQMATGSSIATFMMRQISGGIETVTGKLYEAARLEKPEYLKWREQESLLIKESQQLKSKNNESLEKVLKTEEGRNRKAAGLNPLTGKAEREFIDNEIRSREIELELIDVRKKREEADVKSRGAVPTSGSAPGAAEAPPSPSGQAGAPSLTTIRSKEGLTASVAKEAAGQLQGILDYFGKVGYPVRSLGGYNNRNIGKTNIKSQHAYGYAIDVNPAENPYGSRLITDMPAGTGAAAASLGLGWGANWPNVKDAMHFSVGGNEGGKLRARTGGIFSGPESGYAVELHDTEAVVNLDGDGVSQRSLNTSELPANDDEKMMIELFNMMAQKLETATSIVSDGTSKQRIYTTFNG